MHELVCHEYHTELFHKIDEQTVNEQMKTSAEGRLERKKSAEYGEGKKKKKSSNPIEMGRKREQNQARTGYRFRENNIAVSCWGFGYSETV